MENKYIIKMESDLITELKILNLLISETTQENTTKAGMLQNGEILNANIVIKHLQNALQRLNVLIAIFVQENVINIINFINKERIKIVLFVGNRFG